MKIIKYIDIIIETYNYRRKARIKYKQNIHAAHFWKRLQGSVDISS